MVELTAVTCFFNYFARFCQGAGLPLESWARESPNALPQAAAASEDTARVTLASDAEMQMGAKLLSPSPELKKGLGIGIANSQRAMLRVPDIGEAWWSYSKAAREGAKLAREMQLQISFAFTDGLRLPSEDEAVKVYQEVYGPQAYRAYPHTYAAPVSR